MHYGAVVLLVGAAEFGGHGGFVVEVGEAAIRVEGTGVQDGLGRLLDLRPLCLRGIRPGEIVVDDRCIILIFVSLEVLLAEIGLLNLLIKL